ncbi:hypothetical protein TeGR_g3966, partial [Tetraparma gracilis]
PPMPPPPLPRSTPPAAIDALHASQLSFFSSGATLPLAFRRAALLSLRSLVTSNEAAICAALRKDLGKAPFEGAITETTVVVDEVDHALRHLAAWTAETAQPSAGVLLPASASVLPSPRGVTLVIGPFNYPVSTLLGPLASALAAGDTAVLKPSELCPETSRLFAELVPRYFDEELVGVVEGEIPETTRLMEKEWGLVFFTGSERVAKIIGVSAAKTLSPMVLELGGKSPCIITKNHPELKAMCDRIAWGKTINAGQTCVAPDYLLVQEDVADDVVAGLKSSLRSMFGDDVKKSVFSRNVSEMHTKRLVEMIGDAESLGGTVVCGGAATADIPGRYFEPTIILNPPKSSRVLTEEIFGCVLPVVTYKTDADAAAYVRGMRGTPLAFYVFTRSDAAFRKFLDACPSGGAVMNDVLVHFATITIPF